MAPTREERGGQVVSSHDLHEILSLLPHLETMMAFSYKTAGPLDDPSNCDPLIRLRPSCMVTMAPKDGHTCRIASSLQPRPGHQAEVGEAEPGVVSSRGAPLGLSLRPQPEGVALTPS